MSHTVSFPVSPRLIPILLLPLLLIAGCASPRWYHAKGNQADFDRDSEDCRFLAEKLSRQQTVTGHPNYELFIKAYESCLASKGWSTTPPTTENASVKAPQPAVKTGQLVQLSQAARMDIFGYTLILPEDFSLQKRYVSTFGPTRIETLFWQGPGPTFVNCIAQQSDEASLKIAGFPVTAPFKVYDKGGGPKGRERRLQWTSFFGQTSSGWVGGLGAFLTSDSDKRILLTITTPLPEGDPGLTLTSEQRQAMNTFSEHWISNLSELCLQKREPIFSKFLSKLQKIIF